MNRLMLVRTYALAAVTAVALLATPQTVAAQESAASLTAVSAPVGPVVAPVAAVRSEAATTNLMTLQNDGRNNRNVVWMVVGGGMLLAGSLVGDDVGTIISVTGLVIGLVGVYRYLR